MGFHLILKLIIIKNKFYLFQPNQILICPLTIQIELNGSPGHDDKHRSRAHYLLPQPLKMKILIQDIQMKHSSIIIEQVSY